MLDKTYEFRNFLFIPNTKPFVALFSYGYVIRDINKYIDYQKITK